jgi:hypothetical protein
MRSKRNLIVSMIIGLSVALSTMIYSATSANASAPHIVGTWDVTIPTAPGNPRPTFQALLTFFADGNFVETNTGNPATTAPSHGVWIHSGSSYFLTFESFTFDAQGTWTGKVKAYLTIKLDDTNHWNATYTADIFDVAGNVTKNVIHGPASGTRLVVEQR